MFTRGVDCGVWGFLFVGFGFFAGFFLLICILLYIEQGTLTKILFWSVRKPYIFLTLEKKIVTAVFNLGYV